MPPKRMTANPARPSRHFAGKGANASDSSDSEASDAEQQQQQQAQPPKKRTIAPPPKVSGPGKIISTGAAKPSASDAARKAAAAKKLADVERQARDEGFVTESEEEGSGEGSGSGIGSESGSGSSEEEEDSSSEDEAPRRPVMVRPKFLSKAAREAQAAQAAQAQGQGQGQLPASSAAITEEDTAAQRRADADALVEEQIQKDLAARLAGKKHWDDDEDADAEEIDDTDDVDPEAEYAAWRLREIKRLVRAREAIAAKEAEIAEKERRQGLSEDARRAEDEARLAAQREEKEGRGRMGYMQKYFHKGAFYQGESAALGLDKRDLAGARFADTVRDAELLPAALQMRDMTRLGRKGASKYKDLKSEDTGSWGRVEGRGAEGRGQWDRYGDGERGGFGARQGGDVGGQGANALPLGQRKEKREKSRSREDRRGGDSYRRERSRSRSPRRRDRSRSRSPRRHRDSERDGRKRDYSRERDRHDDDKRRRVDAR